MVFGCWAGCQEPACFDDFEVEVQAGAGIELGVEPLDQVGEALAQGLVGVASRKEGLGLAHLAGPSGIHGAGRDYLAPSVGKLPRYARKLAR